MLDVRLPTAYWLTLAIARDRYLLLSGELEITHVDSLGMSQRLGFLSDGAFFGADIR